MSDIALEIDEGDQEEAQYQSKRRRRGASETGKPKGPQVQKKPAGSGLPAKDKKRAQVHKKQCQLKVDTFSERLARRPPRHLTDQVMEVFSPPRVLPVATAAGLRGNLSVDLETGWDLLDKPVQYAVLQEVRWREPRFLVLSPPCTMYSALQRSFNLGKMSLRGDQLQRRWAEAHTLLDFSMDLAMIQVRGGRKFLFEHPDTASSWERGSVQQVLRQEGCFLVRFDMCRFGLVSPSGSKPLRKRTKFLTNCVGIKALFDGKWCQCKVPHLPIQGSERGVRVSQHAQKYPVGMVRAIVEACKG